MVRQEHLIALVGTLLIGSAVLLGVGCAGPRSEAPKEQGPTETTKEQARSPAATASEGEARCEGMQTADLPQRVPASAASTTTNDLPGCPKGGLLSGTDKPNVLDGKDGDNKVHGLGAKDKLIGGLGSDVIYDGRCHCCPSGSRRPTRDTSKDVLYGGPGNDQLNDFNGGDDVLYEGDGDDVPLIGGKGEDLMYGGAGNDELDGASVDWQQRDKLYCSRGKDDYVADKNDHVSSSCEQNIKLEDCRTIGGPKVA